MKSKLLRLTAVIFGMLVVSCSPVVMKQALPWGRMMDKESVDGYWQIGDAVVHAKMAEDGRVHAAGSEWDEAKQAFHLKKFQLLLTKGEQMNYLSAEQNGSDGNALLGFKVVGNDLIIWSPNPEAFAQAIKAGKLQGEAKKDSVLLTSSPEEVLAFLEDSKNANLWNLTNPLVGRRK